MKVCTRCEQENFDTSTYCFNCGEDLDKTLTLNLFRGNIANPKLPLAPSEPELTLMVVTANGTKPISIPYGKPITLGRLHRSAQALHIDLSDFEASELGVSRLHAAIDYNIEGPTITDLNSTNGTYLNGKKLKPRQPHTLLYGDVLRLGRLVIHICT